MAFTPYEIIEPTDLNKILNGTSYREWTLGWDGISAKEGTITLVAVESGFGNIRLLSNASVLGDVDISLPSVSGTLLVDGDLEILVSNSITTTEFFLNSPNLTINSETGVFALKTLISNSITTNELETDTMEATSMTLNGWLFEVV